MHSLYTHSLSVGMSTDSTQPLILNVSDSEECIRECAIIYGRESTVYYLNATCFCMTIAQLNAMIQDEQSAPDYGSDVEPLPSPITGGFVLSLNESSDCLLPGDECTSSPFSEHDECCDSAHGGDTHCLYQNYAADGTKVGFCCVKNSAFGCDSDADCCSGSRVCHFGFCLKSEEIPTVTPTDSQSAPPQPVAPVFGAMIAEGLMAQKMRIRTPRTATASTTSTISVSVLVMAFCIWFVIRCRLRSKAEAVDSLDTVNGHSI